MQLHVHTLIFEFNHMTLKFEMNLAKTYWFYKDGRNLP